MQGQNDKSKRQSFTDTCRYAAKCAAASQQLVSDATLPLAADTSMSEMSAATPARPAERFLTGMRLDSILAGTLQQIRWPSRSVQCWQWTAFYLTAHIGLCGIVQLRKFLLGRSELSLCRKRTGQQSACVCVSGRPHSHTDNSADDDRFCCGVASVAHLAGGGQAARQRLCAVQIDRTLTQTLSRC